MESAQEYKKRILSYTGTDDPVSIMKTTMRRLISECRRISGRAWQTRPGEGKWSLAQILSHLAEGEVVVAYRLRKMLNASGCEISGYDQNGWVANAHYLQKDPAAALELFCAVRRSNLSLLKSLSLEQWECYGLHSERGKETVRQLVRLVAGHDRNHLRQVEAIRKELEIKKR